MLAEVGVREVGRVVALLAVEREAELRMVRAAPAGSRRCGRRRTRPASARISVAGPPRWHASQSSVACAPVSGSSDAAWSAKTAPGPTSPSACGSSGSRLPSWRGGRPCGSRRRRSPRGRTAGPGGSRRRRPCGGWRSAGSRSRCRGRTAAARAAGCQPSGVWQCSQPTVSGPCGLALAACARTVGGESGSSRSSPLCPVATAAIEASNASSKRARRAAVGRAAWCRRCEQRSCRASVSGAVRAAVAAFAGRRQRREGELAAAGHHRCAVAGAAGDARGARPRAGSADGGRGRSAPAPTQRRVALGAARRDRRGGACGGRSTRRPGARRRRRNRMWVPVAGGAVGGHAAEAQAAGRRTAALHWRVAAPAGVAACAPSSGNRVRSWSKATCRQLSTRWQVVQPLAGDETVHLAPVRVAMAAWTGGGGEPEQLSARRPRLGRPLAHARRQLGEGDGAMAGDAGHREVRALERVRAFWCSATVNVDGEKPATVWQLSQVVRRLPCARAARRAGRDGSSRSARSCRDAQRLARRVTALAGDLAMLAAQREAGLVVVETGARRAAAPAGRRVALLAAAAPCGPACGSVWQSRAARVRHPSEDRLAGGVARLVAARAGHLPVRAGQREARLVVIEAGAGALASSRRSSGTAGTVARCVPACGSGGSSSTARCAMPLSCSEVRRRDPPGCGVAPGGWQLAQATGWCCAGQRERGLRDDRSRAPAARPPWCGRRGSRARRAGRGARRDGRRGRRARARGRCGRVGAARAAAPA